MNPAKIAGVESGMFFRKMKFEVAVLCLCFTVTGCRQSSRPEGHYEGSLLQRVGDTISQQVVSSDISYLGDGSGQISVTRPDKTLALTLAFTQLDQNGFSISLPGVLAGQTQLSQDSGCYVAHSPNVRFCSTSDKFLFEVLREDQSPIFTLSGDHFSHEAHFELEKPTSYSLESAVTVALHKNFESRIEFEHLIQAKTRASAAQANLLPHLSLSTILSNLTPNLLSVLGCIGDLAPFLLPNRWLQADEAEHQSRAESDAFLLMRADLATEVEGLVYTLQRDQAIQGVYQRLIDRAARVQTQVQGLESGNQMPDGSTDHVQAIVDSMKMDFSALGLLIQEEKAAIAGALGFHSPEAVDNVTVGGEHDPIESAQPKDHGAFSDLVLGRSIELRQMDELIQIAHDQKQELSFNWLDPAGDSTANLGFELGPTVAVANSRINELLTTREELQTQILGKLYSAVAEMNQAIGVFAQMNQDLTLQDRRLNRVIAQIGPGSSLNTLDVEGIFQDSLSAGVRAESIKAGYRIARSKLDRQLLQGFYNSVPVNP